MKLFSKNHNNSGASTVVSSLVDQISAIQARLGTKTFNADNGNSAISVESLTADGFSELKQNVESVVSELRSTLFCDGENALLKGYSKESQDLALESAALALLQGQNPAKLQTALTTRPDVVTGGVMVPLALESSSANDGYSMEAFEPVVMQKYLAYASIASALQISPMGEFDAEWYPQKMLPAGTFGIDLSVKIPRVWRGVKRSLDGTPNTFTKTSIITALRKNSVLDPDYMLVLPWAESATLPVALVPAATIPTITRTVAGLDYDTRPIKFGIGKTELIGISRHPGLLAGQVFTEQDTLDTVINIGDIWYSLTVGGVTAVFNADVSTLKNSLLMQNPQGAPQDYFTTGEFTLYLDQNFTTYDANGPDLLAAIYTVLNITPGTKFRLSLTFRLTAQANTERATMSVDFNGGVISEYLNAGGEVMAVNTIAAATTCNGLGYLPRVKRTNSNLRTTGLIIDSNVSTNYRYSCPLGEPFISQSPINAEINTSLEALNTVVRIFAYNSAVSELTRVENILRANNGLPALSSFIAAEYDIVPTFREITLDLPKLVASLNSKDNAQNLRGLIYSSLIPMVNEVLQSSHYKAALFAMTNNANNFVVNIVTDTVIAGQINIDELNEEGKKSGIEFKLQVSLNEEFYGKMKIGFRLKSRSSTEVSPLDSGMQLFSPALTFQLPLTIGGSVTQIVHTVPRLANYTFLPILMVVNVVGLHTANDYIFTK